MKYLFHNKRITTLIFFILGCVFFTNGQKQKCFDPQIFEDEDNPIEYLNNVVDKCLYKEDYNNKLSKMVDDWRPVIIAYKGLSKKGLSQSKEFLRDKIKPKLALANKKLIEINKQEEDIDAAKQKMESLNKAFLKKESEAMVTLGTLEKAQDKLKSLIELAGKEANNKEEELKIEKTEKEVNNLKKSFDQIESEKQAAQEKLLSATDELDSLKNSIKKLHKESLTKEINDLEQLLEDIKNI